ncbi:MAG: aspartate kinase, partial [Halieaceae bacterium]|nr:aspartate kinase [Halieaceae bacterium]
MTVVSDNSISVEKIGGTSMSDYAAVRDNIILNPVRSDTLYRRVFVVSAYAGVTDALLDHKKSGRHGVYGLFASGRDEAGWQEALQALREHLHGINRELFGDQLAARRANQFIDQRLDGARECLEDLQRLCQHGHFSLQQHL